MHPLVESPALTARKVASILLGEARIGWAIFYWKDARTPMMVAEVNSRGDGEQWLKQQIRQRRIEPNEVRNFTVRKARFWPGGRWDYLT